MNGIQLRDYDIDISVKRNAVGEIATGLVIGDILRQNQALILSSTKGEFKENPLLGCNISNMLLDYDPALWRQVIREQLEQDGETVNEIKITKNGISIDAQYL